MSTTKTCQSRFRVVSYVLNGEYRTTDDMGYRTFTSAFVGSNGEQYAVVQRSDRRFQIIDLWETTEDSSGNVYPCLCESFEDEGAAIVAACLK